MNQNGRVKIDEMPFDTYYNLVSLLVQVNEIFKEYDIGEMRYGDIEIKYDKVVKE